MGSEEEGFPNGSAKRGDSVAKFITEDPMGRQWVLYSSQQGVPDGSSSEIMVVLENHSRSMKDVIGIVDNLGKKMLEKVRNLEDRMKEGSMAERGQRKKGSRESRRQIESYDEGAAFMHEICGKPVSILSSPLLIT